MKFQGRNSQASMSETWTSKSTRTRTLCLYKGWVSIWQSLQKRGSWFNCYIIDLVHRMSFIFPASSSKLLRRLFISFLNIRFRIRFNIHHKDLEVEKIDKEGRYCQNIAQEMIEIVDKATLNADTRHYNNLLHFFIFCPEKK